MTSFKDRQSAFENKYAHDQDMLFKIEARTSKLFGLWAAGQMGMAGDDAVAYAKTMVAENLTEAGYDDIRRKVVADFAGRNVSVSDHMIETALAQSMADAAAQVESESAK